MKVIIEPIQKIKPFEPFNVVIPVESWEDLHKLHKALNKSIVPEADFDGFLIIDNIFDVIDKEKQRQQKGFMEVLTEKIDVNDLDDGNFEPSRKHKKEKKRGPFKNFDKDDEEME